MDQGVAFRFASLLGKVECIVGRPSRHAPHAGAVGGTLRERVRE
jgi:hypothetical protein